MDRLVAARERVQKVKADLRGPQITHPCINCRYYEFACTHPAVSTITVNPETGKAKSKAADPIVARSEGGPCGPEGALFDPRSAIGLAVAHIFSSKWRIWAVLWAAVILLAEFGPHH